ncbi:MAG: LTA synthase family protein, partial [Bacillota bacterium]
MTCKTKLAFGMIFFLWLIHFSIYNHFTWGALLIFTLPFALALGLRVFFTQLFSYHLVLVLFLILNVISETKYFFTRRALTVQDIFYVKQASSVSGFMPLGKGIIIALALLSLFIPYKKWQPQKKFLPALGALVYAVYLYGNSLPVFYATNAALAKLQIGFNYFSLHDNIKQNGIFAHLIQTLAMDAKPKPGPHNFFANMRQPAKALSLSLEGYDIFVITCESCYFEDNPHSLLHNDFDRLLQTGHKLSGVVSPVYGGNTVEAEFEAITGFPANGLPGVKFQLYGKNFSPKETLPMSLKRKGYTSYYYHNGVRSIWNRKVALPKFGFEKEFFLRDMKMSQEQSAWPPDSIAYNKVLEQYAISAKSPTPVYNQVMTFYTHGPYPDENGDGGVGIYNHKVKVVVDDYLAFEQKLSEIAKKNGRKIAIFMFGDHKPSLNEVYYKNDTFPKNYFSEGSEALSENDFHLKQDFSSDALTHLGNVSLFFKLLNEDTPAFPSEFANKPIYCLPAMIANLTGTNSSKYFT